MLVTMTWDLVNFGLVKTIHCYLSMMWDLDSSEHIGFVCYADGSVVALMDPLSH